jgi:hypothetical protein
VSFIVATIPPPQAGARLEGFVVHDSFSESFTRNQFADISALAGLTQLTHLHLQYNNPSLPRSEITKLKKALPKCRIYHRLK